jgi:hypothetical protein
VHLGWGSGFLIEAAIRLWKNRGLE